MFVLRKPAHFFLFHMVSVIMGCWVPLLERRDVDSGRLRRDRSPAHLPQHRETYGRDELMTRTQ